MSTSHPQTGFTLWQCIEAAGIDRGSVYATNAVKHFKHEVRGKRRLHKRPDAAEVRAALVEDLEVARRLAGADG